MSKEIALEYMQRKLKDHSQDAVGVRNHVHELLQKEIRIRDYRGDPISEIAADFLVAACGSKTILGLFNNIDKLLFDAVLIEQDLADVGKDKEDPRVNHHRIEIVEEGNHYKFKSTDDILKALTDETIRYLKKVDGVRTVSIQEFKERFIERTQNFITSAVDDTETKKMVEDIDSGVTQSVRDLEVMPFMNRLRLADTLVL